MARNNSLAYAEERLAALVHRRADEEDAERRADQREKVRRDDLKCQALMAEFQPDYQAFNATPPPARADEWASDFEKRLLRGLQRRLAPSHELNDPHLLDQATGRVLENMGGMARAAAAAEAENLPAPGEFLERVRVDEMTGQKRIEFYGRESFIRDMNRSGRRVARLMDPTLGKVLIGAPYPTMPR